MARLAIHNAASQQIKIPTRHVDSPWLPVSQFQVVEVKLTMLHTTEKDLLKKKQTTRTKTMPPGQAVSW